ncbi:MAG: hypothetical protein PHG91_13280 [Syntrophales bacterium]|nr:hypothetical protein [Syntrophales bacterium]MDD5533775.1 hypothetical protein [Syntrophales bacterium]
MPLWTVFLAGREMEAHAAVILEHLFVIIVAPAVLASVFRRQTVRRRGKEAFEKIKFQLQDMAGTGLLLLVFVIFVLNGRFAVSNCTLLAQVFCPAAMFSMLLFFGSTLLTALFRSDYGDSVAFTIGVSLKNTAVCMALATAVFQDRTALAVAVAGPLAQFPIMLGYLKIGNDVQGFTRLLTS